MKEGYNLLVSFASEDNSAAESVKGWVDSFCRYLRIFVSRLASYEVTITSTLELKDTGATPQNAIFVPIISPHYFESERCVKELQQQLTAGNQIFHVQHLPVSKSDLPKELATELSYNFYERSVETENGYLLYDANFNKNYWLKLIDLAYDLVQFIALSEHEKLNKNGKTVYLAETTFDQQDNRDMLKRELQRYGHTILPDHPLPDDPTQLEKAITEYIEKSQVAIHLIGAYYGEPINGTDLSLVEFQNKVAQELTEKHGKQGQQLFKRYLWSPPYLRPADEKQMLFLDQLKEEADQLTEAEIIQVPLEMLKSIVEKNLKNLRVTKKVTETIPAENDEKSVYLVYDKEDEPDLKEVKNQLEKEKIAVISPDFEGDQLNLLNRHRENLVKCSAVLIYSNRSNRFWLSSKINDVIKSPGFGKSFPFLVKAVCALNNAFDATKVKEYSDLITLANLNNDSMNSFLGKLK